MKNSILSILFVAISTFNFGQNIPDRAEKGTTITVTVNLRGSGGHILIGLHTKDTFLKDALQKGKSEIKDGIATVTFNNVLPGTYGILVLHDKNDNNRMDFDQNGMPLEAYGTSNNVISYGPPQWEDAKFKVEETPLNIEIRI